jgi:hypothetical protein
MSSLNVRYVADDFPFQIGKWQSMEGEEAVSQQLVEMIDQMKGMLVQASTSSESPSLPAIPQWILPQLPSSPHSTTGQPRQYVKPSVLAHSSQCALLIIPHGGSAADRVVATICTGCG